MRNERKPLAPVQAPDPIRAEVMARYLLAAAEEMGATLMRTSFSPNIQERADCSTAIFDAQGQVIAPPMAEADYRAWVGNTPERMSA